MAEADAELGPIDFLVIEFPAGQSTLTGEAVATLAELAASGTIRILDFVVVHKGEDESINIIKAEGLEGLGILGTLEASLAEAVAEQDLVDVAAVMEPGSVAGVLVWENTWAAPFAAAVSNNGGRLIASGHIPSQALLTALANQDNTSNDNDNDE
ncbi:DUF1269 domain-containing protein [Planctomonas sp. JC2975]|nr:DUF1269 domain-containing protein [Planctomonas sp. JC2975]